jgi:sugar phosphate isomerase/epimerase
MKLGISAYSYNRLVKSGAITWFEAIEKVAALGADAIEFAAFDAPEGADKLAYAKEMGAACKAAGLPVVCYAIGADFMSGADSDVDAEVLRLDGELAIAQALGAPLMRHDVGWRFPADYGDVKSFENILPRVADATRRVTERAEALGIRTCTENHGLYMQGSERIGRLCAAVNHTNYGILADVGNFICADEDGAMALGAVYPMVFHVHVKDMLYRSGQEVSPGRGWGRTRGGNYFKGIILGHGSTPLVPALRILKRENYQGYMNIEFEGGDNPDYGLEVSVENMRRFMAMVEAEALTWAT